MKLFATIFLFLSSLTLQANDELPAPYSDLETVMPYSGHGWYMNAAPMEELLKKRNVKVVIELGSWMGKSTKHIAETIPEDGIVYAVDHWLGNPQSRVNTPQLIPTLYEQFLSNMIHSGLAHKVVPLRMTTQEAIEYFYENDIVPDLVYVDASHEEHDVYNDVCAYYPLIEENGIICGDDWGFGDLPIQRAVKRFANEHNLRIETPNNWFWELHKK